MHVATTSVSRPSLSERQARAADIRRKVRSHFVANMAECRRYVFDCMAPTGAHRSLYGEHFFDTFVAAWLKADGFGPGMTREFGEDQCWDWSHVRDSSDEAMLDVAMELAANDRAVGLA